jgi:large subunit ribosomal protein L30
MAQLKITQIRSGIDRPLKHKRVLESLGLRRHQTSRIHEDTPSIRGMINKIPHLLRVEEVK